MPEVPEDSPPNRVCSATITPELTSAAVYAATFRGGVMYPSSSQYDAPSVHPGAIVGLIASTSSAESQRTGSPSDRCIAIRACAASTSAGLKQGSRYPCCTNPESVPISARCPR